MQDLTAVKLTSAEIVVEQPPGANARQVPSRSSQHYRFENLEDLKVTHKALARAGFECDLRVMRRRQRVVSAHLA
jgi:hypothetical protein